MKEKSNTIKDFLSKAKSSPRTASCPVCNNTVLLREINKHLDEPGACPGPTEMVHGLQGEKCKERGADDENPSACDTSDAQEITNMLSDSNDEYEETSCLVSFSSPTKAKASLALSKSPSKFGLSQEDFNFSPTPKKMRIGRRSITSPFSSQESSNSKDEEIHKDSTAEKAIKHIPFTQSKKQDPTFIPYYVLNFEHIVNSVIDFTDDRDLFDHNELEMIDRYRRCSLNARKLYVRLFNRKLAWINISALKYEEIHDLQSAIDELTSNRFLENESSIEDLETLLRHLSAPDVKTIAKEMNISPKGSQKPDFIKALLSHSRRKSFFTANSADIISSKIKSRAKSLLGKSFKLEEETRRVFLRVLSLYSLTDWWDERENDRGQPQQLTTTLLVNQGKMVFPCFDILRQRRIFRNRDDLLRFEDGCSLEGRMREVFESKSWPEALPIYEETLTLFREVLKDDELSKHANQLPTFLRRFTLGSVLAYVLTKSVEVMERLKKHGDAVKLLQTLLEQYLYLPDYRGHWYERLVLDLDQHLKKPLESLKAIKNGLSDVEVREARNLSLCQRVLKICNAKRNKDLLNQLEEFQSHPNWVKLSDTPKVILQGKMMSKENIPGAKTVFIHKSGEDSLFCSVEEYVREVYRDQEMTEGVHAEGAVVNTICALLFWDILYDVPVADAFRSPNQGYPLDYDSDHFYENRKSQIDERLEDLKTMSDDDLDEWVNSIWYKNKDTISCVNWEIFQGPDHVLGLIKCFSRHQLHGICERLIKRHRFTRSGFPDLTVWNPVRKSCKIIEVKGPNDRLSNKQILWIDYLQKLGIDAFVCHVEANGGRNLSSKRSPESIQSSRQSSPCSKKNNRKPKKRQRKGSGDDFQD